MGKRIVFIQPRAEFDAYGFILLPLLGSLYLGTLLAQAGHEVSVLVDKGPLSALRRGGRLHPLIRNADVVAISVMTSTAPRAYRIADLIRAKYPRTRVVLGGPHPTFCPEEALEHADLVVRGEGEGIVDAIVDDAKGILDGKHLDDLDSLPIPDLNLLGKMVHLVRYVPLSGSRGCPFDCSFCSVTAMFGRKFRFRSVENVLDELAYRHRHGMRKIFFTDDHFAMQPERTKAILEGMLKRGLDIHWMAQVRIEVAQDPELLELISRTKCSQLFIGLESINPATLKAYNKHQTVEDIRDCLSKLRKYNIPVCGMFVIGADDDTPESLEATLKFSIDEGLDNAQFTILIPLPGTRIYTQMEEEGRILDRNWAHYDGTHVVFRPCNFSRLTLQEQAVSMWERFYATRSLLQRSISKYYLRLWRKINRPYMKSLKAEAVKGA